MSSSVKRERAAPSSEKMVKSKKHKAGVVEEEQKKGEPEPETLPWIFRRVPSSLGQEHTKAMEKYFVRVKEYKKFFDGERPKIPFTSFEDTILLRVLGLSGEREHAEKPLRYQVSTFREKPCVRAHIVCV